jgi:hypothetical protein
MAASLPAQAPLIVYFTDHGGQGFISMAGDEDMDVDDLRKVIYSLPKDRKLILIHDHCYSASMLEAIWKDGTPRPHTCGFASAADDEESFTGQEIMTEMSHDPSVNNFLDLAQNVRSRLNLSSTYVSSSDLFVRKYLKSHRELLQTSPSNHLCALTSPFYETTQGLGLSLTATLELRLQSEIGRLQATLAQQFKAAKIDPNISGHALKTMLKNKKDELKRASDEDDKISDTLLDASEAFIRSHFTPAQWKKTEALQAQADAIREKLRKPIRASLHSALEAKLDRLLPKLGQFNAEVARLKSMANSGAPEFKTFIAHKAHGKKWPLDISDRHQKAVDKVDQLQKDQKALLKLSMSADKATAIHGMLQNHDFQALKTYVDMLDCERIRIDRGGQS